MAGSNDRESNFQIPLLASGDHFCILIVRAGIKEQRFRRFDGQQLMGILKARDTRAELPESDAQSAAEFSRTRRGSGHGIASCAISRNGKGGGPGVLGIGPDRFDH
jgi:hypothetical protein